MLCLLRHYSQNIHRSACHDQFFCNTITGAVLSPWFVQLQRDKIQGRFKDKLQFSRSKICSINWHSLTPFWTRYWLKHSMESFTIFTSSAMVDHLSHCCTTFRNNTTLQNVNSHWVWLAVWDTEIALEIKKEREIKYWCFRFYTDHLFSFHCVELFLPHFVPFVFPMF